MSCNRAASQAAQEGRKSVGKSWAWELYAARQLEGQVARRQPKPAGGEALTCFGRLPWLCARPVALWGGFHELTPAKALCTGPGSERKHSYPLAFATGLVR